MLPRHCNNCRCRRGGRASGRFEIAKAQAALIQRLANNPTHIFADWHATCFSYSRRPRVTSRLETGLEQKRFGPEPEPEGSARVCWPARRRTRASYDLKPGSSPPPLDDAGVVPPLAVSPSRRAACYLPLPQNPRLPGRGFLFSLRATLPEQRRNRVLTWRNSRAGTETAVIGHNS